MDGWNAATRSAGFETRAVGLRGRRDATLLRAATTRPKRGRSIAAAR